MNEKEFLDLVSAHKGIILKVSNLYADDPEDRKDLRQEILLQCWKSMANFKGESQFQTWLYRISLNVSLTFLSKRKKQHRLTDLSPEKDFVEPPEHSERADRLYRAIRQLNEVDRGIIMLHLDGYDNTAISEITGASRNNTGVKLHRIKQQLTAILNRKQDELTGRME